MADHPMLPAVIELGRASLPENWILVDDNVRRQDAELKEHQARLEAEKKKMESLQVAALEGGEGGGEPDASGTKPRRRESTVAAYAGRSNVAESLVDEAASGAPYYRNVVTQEEVDTHPASACMRRIVQGMRSRASIRRKQKVDPLASWIQFSDGASTYFYSFKTGTKQPHFPTLGIAATPYPLRVLEPTAKLVAEAASMCWGNLHNEKLENTIRRERRPQSPLTP